MQEERQRNKDKTGGGSIGSMSLGSGVALSAGAGAGGPSTGGDCASESGGPSSAGGGSGGSGGAPAATSSGVLVPPLELVSIGSLERAEQHALLLPDQFALPLRRVGLDVCCSWRFFLQTRALCPVLCIRVDSTKLNLIFLKPEFSFYSNLCTFYVQ